MATLMITTLNKVIDSNSELVDPSLYKKMIGRCENVKLQMSDYYLKTHIFAINLAGCDIVLAVEWLYNM